MMKINPSGCLKHFDVPADSTTEDSVINLDTNEYISAKYSLDSVGEILLAKVNCFIFLSDRWEIVLLK